MSSDGMTAAMFRIWIILKKFMKSVD